MTENNAPKLHICIWPRHGLPVIDIHTVSFAESMMGQMEYPNRTADPDEQLYKTSRL